MANIEKTEAVFSLVKNGFWTIFWLFILIALLFSQCDKKNTDTKEDKETMFWVENNIVKEPFLVCFTKEDYIALQDFIANKDDIGSTALHKSGRCTVLKAGARISIIEYNVFSPAKIRAYAEDGASVDLYTSYGYLKEKS